MDKLEDPFVDTSNTKLTHLNLPAAKEPYVTVWEDSRKLSGPEAVAGARRADERVRDLKPDARGLRERIENILSQNTIQ
jgi:hypothetical protein